MPTLTFSGRRILDERNAVVVALRGREDQDALAGVVTEPTP